MLTLHKRRLASLTTLTGLSIFSAGMALADTDGIDVANPDSGSYRPDERTDRMTCSDALQLAWFKRQVEMTEGSPPPDESLEPAPSECERDIVAGASDVG